jgi:hypothetical protein
VISWWRGLALAARFSVVVLFCSSALFWRACTVQYSTKT